MDINEVLTVTEAGELFGKDVGNLRKEFIKCQNRESDKFKYGTDIRKSGKVWLVLYSAMERVHVKLEVECEVIGKSDIEKQLKKIDELDLPAEIKKKMKDAAKNK